MRTFSRKYILLLLALPLLLAGCIEGSVNNFVRYDAKDDSFWFLDVYGNINADSPADRDYMARLWKERDSILIRPLGTIHLTPEGTFELHLFTEEAYQRVGKDQYRTIDLSSPATTEPPLQTTTLDLSAIRAVPGKFFINQFGTLSYYQQMAVPGRVVDEVLVKCAPIIARSLGKAADEQIAGAKKGGKPLDWADIRGELVRTINESDNPQAAAAKPADKNALLPLDSDTLRLMRSALADNSVKLRRAGSVFTLVLPVSKHDGAEAAATFAAAKAAVNERVKAGKKVDDQLVSLLAAVEIRYIEGAGLELSADSARLAKLAKNDTFAKPDEKKREGYRATIAAIAAHGIEIDKNFSIQGLLDEYVK